VCHRLVAVEENADRVAIKLGECHYHSRSIFGFVQSPIRSIEPDRQLENLSHVT
jgi:hypothetical protein